MRTSSGYSTPWCTTPRALISVTPDGAHMATTLALLAAGKHVFCEKPLAPNYADALAMTEAAESAGLVNMVNLTYRNSPAIQKARAIVAEADKQQLSPISAKHFLNVPGLGMEVSIDFG